MTFIGKIIAVILGMLVAVYITTGCSLLALTKILLIILTLFVLLYVVILFVFNIFLNRIIGD